MIRFFKIKNPASLAYMDQFLPEDGTESSFDFTQQFCFFVTIGC